MKNLFDVKDKVVLLTGAAGFLGKHMGCMLTDQGAKVIGLSKSDYVHRLDYAWSFQSNLYNREETVSILTMILKKYKVDVLINNAYDMSEATGFGVKNALTGEHWKNAGACLNWTVLLTDIVSEQMRKDDSIINISSMYSLVSAQTDMYVGTDYRNPITYCAMKGAINSITRRYAEILGSRGVRVNSVSPGAFPNESVTDDMFIERLKDNSVLNRVGKPEELVGIILYLASQASTFTTGQNFVIDGGWTCV